MPITSCFVTPAPHLYPCLPARREVDCFLYHCLEHWKEHLRIPKLRRLSVVIKSISSPPDEWKIDTCSIHSTWIQHLFMAQTLRIQRKRTLLLMLRFYNPPHFITRCYCLMLLSSFPHRQMFSGDRIVSHTQVSCSNNLISLYSAYRIQLICSSNTVLTTALSGGDGAVCTNFIEVLSSLSAGTMPRSCSPLYILTET